MRPRVAEIFTSELSIAVIELDSDCGNYFFQIDYLTLFRTP